jgi:hypothetical protein
MLVIIIIIRIMLNFSSRRLNVILQLILVENVTLSTPYCILESLFAPIGQRDTFGTRAVKDYGNSSCNLHTRSQI